VESAELIAILQEVRERVRARNPETAAATNIALADLMPLVHARDAALGKVASIGAVNPRRGGPLNAIVQGWKRLVARLLDWHVREQVEFNRKIVTCIDTAIEALAENNRAIKELGGRVEAAIAQAEELKDIRSHWADWRIEWERKLQQNEMQYLRSAADLQAHFQHRINVAEAGHRDQLRVQHANFTAAVDLKAAGIQQQLWKELREIRLEYEGIIHSELKAIRQRAAIAAPAAGPPAIAAPAEADRPAPQFDYGRFAEKFRGTEEYVRAGQRFYAPIFAGRKKVLDIGCGRGEFLELMRETGVAARGIDLGEESVATCRHKGLEAERADLFDYLAALPERALDGIFCAQVVEHLAPERLPEMIRLAAERLERGGVMAIETPNPECLAIFATHFYLDPTHRRPVPHPLLAFYMEEFGMGNIEVRRLSPAVKTMPSLASLPEDFREAFFGGLDYAIIARKH
jgi:O-antigen chain-terminating methyltransferase